MNKLSVIFILLLSILSFSIISVSAADVITTTIDGNSAVYICYPYDYNITLRNTSVNESAININYVVSLPVGFATSDPLIYNIPFLGPGQSDKRKIHIDTQCNAQVGNISVNGQYNNSAYTISLTKPITVYQGAVTIEKNPSTQNATLENNVSWTITVKSTGLGPIENVVVTDILQPGLQYLSSSPTGVNTGPGTFQWSSTQIPALSHMNPGDEVQIQLKAKVIGCSQLYDTARATWGTCGVCQTQETIASIAFQPNPPKIDYSVPSFNINYCGVGNTFTIPITNTGGKAYDFNLSADFGSLTVANITSPVGATYNSSGKYFVLGDIPNGATNLTFDLIPVGGWCGSLPSGAVIFRPKYLYCGQEFYPPVKFGSYSVQNVPSLSVSKTGAPTEIYLGEQITYNIVASYSGPITCGNSPASNIVVVDTIPAGFSIINAGGGSISGNTITWSVSPSTGLNTNIVLQSPTYSNCEYCYTTATNTVTATVTDCCGCVRNATASQSTILECSETVTSNKTVSSNNNFEKCTPLKYVNTFAFSNISFWDDVNISALKFREEKPNNQILQGQVKIDINGTCVVYYTPLVSTYLDVNFSNVDFTSCFDANTTSVRNTTITIEYNMSTQNSSSPSCGSNSFFDWSILNTGKTEVGSGCYESSQQIRQGVFVPVNDSQMGISISGIPAVVDKCGTYNIELVINRNSSVGAYDVEVVFPLSNYHVNSISYIGYTPLEFNNSPTDFVWRYGDYFATNSQARIQMNVTKRCNDQGSMSANLYWDGLCNRNGIYDRSCSSSSSQNPLVLTGNVCLMKTPELLWATTNKAAWKLCLTNAGSGASYNIWLEDKLGAGLSYNSSSGTYSQLHINQDRNGNPINGATWIIDKINAGDKTEIIFIANVDSCDNLTNLASTSAGCLGGDCQPIKTDTSSVRIPSSNGITTNIIPATINMCDEQTATVIVKNSGLTNIYDVNVTANLPTGISYVAGSGNPSDPENVGTNPIRWTKAQIPGLGSMAPSSEISITFRIRSSCDMPSTGSFTSQATYKTPCNDIKLSPQASSQISRRTPTLSISKQGRNITIGETTYANNVAAEPGDIVEWRLIITNSGSAPATNVEFYDILPTNLTFGGISTNPYPGTGGTIPPGSGTSGDPWKHGTLSNVSPNTATYYVWGTVNPGSCGSATTNTAYVRYGCDDNCRFSYVASTGRSLRTRPNFVRSQTIGTFTTCEGIITINLRNASGYPTAYNVLVTSTLPPGFIFDSMITGPNPTPNPPSNPSQPVWNLGNMAASSTNTVLQFRVKNDGTSCGSVTPGTNNVRIDYQDSCGNNLNVTSTSSLITPLKPVLNVSKTPVIQPVPPGGTGSWTITVTNTGNTPAYNVTLIDTLSSDWGSPIVAGNGPNGEVPNVVGNTITWYIPGPIPQSGGIWSASLSARLNDVSGTGTNGVIAVGKCSNGCIYSSATANARIINIQGLFKESEKEKATIGEEVVFDLAVVYSGVGANYVNATIVDHLPDGIEYVSHTYTDTYGGSIQQFNQNGQILTWKLGTPLGASNRNFTGPNNVLIKITGKIRDIPQNVIGNVLVNNANTSFIQDGAPYNISDLDNVRIIEPHLTIDKSGDKTQGLPGDNVHYTITLRNTGNSSAYDVIIQDQIPSGLILVGGSVTSSPSADTTLIVGDIIQWSYLSIPPNQTVTLEYDATIPPQGGSFTNTATNTIYTSMPGDVPGERIYPPSSDNWNVISPGTDLQKVTLNTDINVPSPGGVVYFRLTITNTGAMALNPVKLIDYLPDGLTYIPGTSIVDGVPKEPDTIVGVPEVLTWNNIGAMNPSDVKIVEFQARVDPGRTGTFINNATVVGTSTIGEVTDSDDSPVGVKGPAINIVKSVQPPWGKAGFTNEYTLVVTNTGEVPLNPVSVTDTLPIGLTYANLASPVPDSVITNSNGTTTIIWNNIGPLAVGESKSLKFSAKFNGLENKSINKAETEGTPPNGYNVSDDDYVAVQKHPGGNPKETIRITTKGYMKRCDLCYDQELLKEARKLITNQNVLDEDDTCCRPDDILEELQIEIVKNNLDNDPRYIRALKLLDDADELCRKAEEAFEKGNYSLAQKLTKEKCQAIGEAIRLMIEVLRSKK